jgi:hypothetical protein
MDWWEQPEVQKDRGLFMQAVASRQPEWIAREREIAQLMNKLQTVDYMVGTPMRRRGFSGVRMGVTW